MKYRNKYPVVEANQWTIKHILPPAPSECLRERKTAFGRFWEVHTTDGWKILDLNDWIVVYENGDCSIWKPEVFMANFEPMEEA